MPPSPASAPVPAPRAPWLRLAVVAGVLALVACRWDGHAGFTALLRFGDVFAERRLPAVAQLPVASFPGPGYDGQFYAQLAVAPNVLRPEVQAALDLPAYRAQRILLPLLAHLAVDPWWILQTFALLNVAAWLVFAHLWWREAVALAPARAPWIWLAGVLSLGALDSVRCALVDLPAALLVLVAVRALRHGAPARAAGWLAAAGLVRETVLLSVPMLTHPSRMRRWALRALCVLPALAWFVWLRCNLPAGAGGFAGNFDWPGRALVTHLVRCGWELAHGNLDSRYLWGLIGAVGFAYQSFQVIYLWRRDRDNPWLRAAIAFAIVFWFLGDFVWHGY